MTEHIQKQYFSLGRNSHQIIRDGSFATRRDYIQNQLYSHHIVENNMRIQGQLRKFNATLIHEHISDFYAYFFLGQLILCSQDRLEDSLNRELQLIKTRQSHHHIITKSLQTRELCLKSLLKYTEALFESNDENATNRFKEEIHNLRYLTAMVIEHIQNWKNYLLAINQVVFEDQHIAFFYQGQDYLLKILGDTDFIINSFLSTKVVFSHKQDPFLMRPFVQKQNDNHYVEYFRFTPQEQTKYIRCLQFLAQERADYLQRKVSIKEQKIKQIEKIYQAKHLVNKIFALKPNLLKKGKQESVQVPIDFVDQNKKSRTSSKTSLKNNLLSDSRQIKFKQLQIRGDKIQKIKDMDFGGSTPLINPKKFSNIESSQVKPIYQINRSVSLGILKKPSIRFVKQQKQEIQTDFQVLLRKKQLQVLESDNIKRRTHSSIKLQDRLSQRKLLNNKEGAQELQKILDQLEHVAPHRQDGFIIRKGSAKKQGKKLLQHNQEVLVHLRKKILKEMEDFQSNRDKNQQINRAERDQMQKIIKDKIDKAALQDIQKQKKKWIQGKDVLAHDLGKKELFGFEESTSKKSYKLTQIEEDLKKEMQLKWLRQVQQQLSHRQALNEHQKQARKQQKQRQKQLQIVMKKKQQEERFKFIQIEERAKAFKNSLQLQDSKKKQIQSELTEVVQRQKQKLQQFSGKQRQKLQSELKETVKAKLLIQMKRQNSQFTSEKKAQQKRMLQQEAHRNQLKQKISQQFQIEQQIQRQRSKQQKSKKLQLVAQKMNHLQQKIKQPKTNVENNKLELIRKSLSDIPDFRNSQGNVNRQKNKKKLRQQFQLQLFGFNRSQNLQVQHDNFVSKDYKNIPDTQQNLNQQKDPIQNQQILQVKQEQIDYISKKITKGTSQIVERQKTQTNRTDKFVRFSQDQKQKKAEKIKQIDQKEEMQNLAVEMSPEEYSIYKKKKTVLNSKRQTFIPNLKQKQKQQLIKNLHAKNNYQIMTNFDNDRQKSQKIKQQQSQNQRQISPSPIQADAKKVHKNSQDLSQVMRLTVHSKMSSVHKKKFVTSDEEDESFDSSPKVQIVKKHQKNHPVKQKQKIAYISPLKQQKLQQDHQKAQLKSVLQAELDNYLTEHFRGIAKLMRKLNLLRKDELLKTIKQCKSIMLIESKKGEMVLGLAIICQNQNKNTIRSLNILHIASVQPQKFLPVLLLTRNLLFDKDPCTQITFSFYYDKEDNEQNAFIKQFQKQFDPYGAIFQKKISNNQTERKHLLRRMIGEESTNLKVKKTNGHFTLIQNLFAHSCSQSLGVELGLKKNGKNLGSWTLLSLFLAKYGNQTQLVQQLTSQIKQESKYMKYLSRMAAKLQEGTFTDLQHTKFISPFEANLKLVEQGVDLIKCDPQIQQKQIAIIWSKLNIIANPILPFISTTAKFHYAHHQQQADYLRLQCIKGTKVIKLKSSLYSSVITVIPCKPNNYKLLIIDSIQYDSLSNISIDLYLKIFLANLAQHTQATDQHIWIPQIAAIQIKQIEEGETFGFSTELRSKVEMSYTDYVGNSVAYSPTHRDMFVTPPFIIATLNSNIQKLTQGSPVFIQRIDIEEMKGVKIIPNADEQSDF